jgi:hypothetical protein
VGGPDVRRDDELALSLVGPAPLCPTCGRRHRDSGVGMVTTLPCVERRRRRQARAVAGRFDPLPRQAPVEVDQLELG